jgi:hypothetical protein
VWARAQNFARGSDPHPPREYAGAGRVSHFTCGSPAGIRLFNPSTILHIFLTQLSSPRPTKNAKSHNPSLPPSPVTHSQAPSPSRHHSHSLEQTPSGERGAVSGPEPRPQAASGPEPQPRLVRRLADTRPRPPPQLKHHRLGLADFPMHSRSTGGSTTANDGINLPWFLTASCGRGRSHSP